MSEDRVYLGLYYDEAASTPLPQQAVDGKLAWVLDFGRLDAGDNKTSEFFIKNISVDTVEDLVVDLVPPMVEGVSAQIAVGRSVSAIESNGVHRVEIRWAASDYVVAGRCQGVLTISAMVLEESRRYRE